MHCVTCILKHDKYTEYTTCTITSPGLQETYTKYTVLCTSAKQDSYCYNQTYFLVHSQGAPKRWDHKFVRIYPRSAIILLINYLVTVSILQIFGRANLNLTNLSDVTQLFIFLYFSIFSHYQDRENRSASDVKFVDEQISSWSQGN